MCISFSTALNNILTRDGVKNANSGGYWGPNPGPLLIALETALKIPALQASCTETAVERILRDNTGKMRDTIRGDDGSCGHGS